MTVWLPLSVLAGLASALLTASLGGSVMLALAVSPFASMPLFLAGLGLGLTPVAVAVLVGTLATGLLGSFELGIAFLLQHALPAILITRHALLSRTMPSGDVHWYPVGGLVLWLMGIAAGVFLAIWTFLALTGEGLGHVLEAALRQMLETAEQPMAPELEAMLVSRLVYIPGLAAVSVMLQVMLNGGLAQRILSRTGRALRPSPRLDQLVLPHWLAILFLAAIFTAGFLEPLRIPGLTLAFILGLAYFLLGLAVVHVFYRSRPAAPFGLVGFYVMLAVMMMIIFPVVLGLVAVGLAEQFLGLRARMGWSGP